MLYALSCLNKFNFAVMEIQHRYLFLLTLSGAIALGISFPFTGGFFPIVFFAFVPVILVNNALNKEKKFRFIKRLGYNYLYFLIFNIITTWWIYYASPEGAYFAVLANALLMTLPFFFSSFIARQLGENRGLIAFAVLWMSFEYAHFYWELSWPWLNLGHVFGNQPKLIQWYEYSGVTGGTLWVLCVNILVYIVIRNIWIRKESLKIQTPIFLFTGLGLCIPVISSLIIYYSYEEKIDPVDIVVVQPNIEAHHEKFHTPWTVQLEKMFRLADEQVTRDVDLVLCPETAINIGLDEMQLEDEQSINYVKSFQRVKYNVPVIIGAFTQKFFKEENSPATRFYSGFWYEDYNSALLVDTLKKTEIYHKSKLVLGSEKLPFVGMFPFLKKYSVELGGTSGILGIGEEPKNFTASGVLFAPVICYESVYGEYVSYYTRKGAEILTVITNDGWWQDSPGHKQHRMFSQIRAIENRRSLARSANTGISCFIDQRGEIISELPYNTAGVLREKINRNTAFTFYVKYGDLYGRIALFMAIGLFIYALVNYLKKRGIKTGV